MLSMIFNPMEIMYFMYIKIHPKYYTLLGETESHVVAAGWTILKTVA